MKVEIYLVKQSMCELIQILGIIIIYTLLSTSLQFQNSEGFAFWLAYSRKYVFIHFSTHVKYSASHFMEIWD